ncbi:MAG: hypothetical protein NVS4B3_08370 [Gemmatimonadaceae bacterium]
MTDGAPAAADRRRRERRGETRLAELSLPELRRIVVTTLLAVAVVVAFLWMVRAVVVAGILGVIVAVYLQPAYDAVVVRVGRPALAAVIVLAVVIVPFALLLAYSVLEVRTLGSFLVDHQADVEMRLELAARRMPLFIAGSVARGAPQAAALAAAYAARAPAFVRDALPGTAVAATLFVFTAIYIFTDGPAIVQYLRGAIPTRYGELVASLEYNVQGVLYGAVYATLVTQALKTIVMYALNIAFAVPLAAALSVVSFVVGFFPIVGSWSVYLPVALWLWAWRGDAGAAVAVATLGFAINTLFLSTYVRPKLAADRSGVLNFYWMLVALITGVYTFGLPGVLLGPVLIGLLKAVVDTVAASAGWRVLDDGSDLASDTAPT